jgi:hypothetical protein
MEKIKTASELKSAIQQLEIEQSTQLLLLKDEFYFVCERLKPINIIKDTLKDACSEADFKTTLTDNFIGVGSGLIAKKIILGKTNNPITRFLGLFIEKFVSNAITKNAEKIKTVAGAVLEKMTRHGN